MQVGKTHPTPPAVRAYRPDGAVPHAVEAGGGPEPVAEGDELTISPASRGAVAVMSLRARRLADIRAAINAGTYETEARLESAVDRMLQDLR